jgi:two-component SAPR family response regulator/Flp pilus assembly protein TadD
MLAAMKGNLQEASRLLHMVVPIYRKDHDVAGLTLALTRRAHTLRLLGKYSASIKDVEEALQLAETDPSLQPLYAEALRIKGLNLYRLGQSRNAVEELEHSLSLYSELKETGSIPMLLAETAMVYAAVGNIESAKTSYQEALKIWRAEKNLYSQADTLNNLAVLYHQLGEYELASETYENGLACARSSHNQRAESLILTGLGDLYSEIEEFEAAKQAYEQAEVIAHGLAGFFLSNYLELARTNLALMQDDLQTASQILKLFRKKLKTNPSVYERGLWALLEGRSHLLNGNSKKAVSLLQECKTLFTQDGRDLEIRWSTIWLTAAYDEAGLREDARAEIKELLATGAKPDHAVLVTLRQVDAWLSDLQNDPEIGRQLRGLLEKSRRLTLKMPSTRRALRRHAQSIQMPVASLTIRAFGRADVSINGRSIPMSDWRTQSVRDLFFYFLYTQEAVTKEQVAEVLWPEIEDPQALKARFKNEIYRLRRAAGRDVITFDDEYYLFNRALDYEYDVEAFDSHLNRARKARDVKERIEHLQKAVDLVRGPYLADVDAHWAAPERERLGLAYVSALEELAQLYLNANQLERCLSICQLALDRDPCHEVIYQVEMRVYATLGDRASIARRYQACKATLKEVLGLAPSEETELIYRELTG